ncbi:hypothetical protein P7K49_028241, partial [Saguinus oedipus]
ERPHQGPGKTAALAKTATLATHGAPTPGNLLLQQLELAQIQHRDANLTALAAIGPRKKRPLESG